MLGRLINPDEGSAICDSIIHLVRLHQTIMNGSIDVITPTYQLSKAFWVLPSRHRRTRLWAVVRLCLNVPRATYRPSRNLRGAKKREHNLQRSEIEGKATKERQSLSVENEYASVALKSFREPMTIHYQGENQCKRHEGRRNCGFSDHRECTSEPGSW